jgi:hypothetical protein
MAAFPTLKTGAVVQYPATKAVRYASSVIRFIDGSDQRYRDYAAPLEKWEIRLDLLDQSELYTLEQFFNTQEGRFGTFSFTDPWTQVLYSSCSIDQDSLKYELTEEARGNTSVVVVENRT